MPKYNSKKCALIVPTLNAANNFGAFLEAVGMQLYMPGNLMVIDSSSSDETVQMALQAGLVVHSIGRSEFDHGTTRQKAIDLLPQAEIYIFLTQDAVLASPESLLKLLTCFDDKKVGAAYGRQLPHPGALPIASHARLFNYPSESCLKTTGDIKYLGIKAAFISNSFAAYRRTALMSVGGFPLGTIFGEDTQVAAKLLEHNWTIAYCSEASAYHSHNYSFFEEFRRYFDTGVFHSRERWFLELLGWAEGEGKKFIFSELCYLMKKAPWYIPSAISRTFIKYFGYRLGCVESRISVGIKKKLSMNKGYWK